MSNEESIREIRLEKLARMRELGFDPYRVEKWEKPLSADQIFATFEEGKGVSFAGRIVSYRDMGKAGFAHLSDGDNKIQAYFRKDELGDNAYEVYKLLDLGDHVGIKGKLFVTKTGEQSIHVDEFHPLSKTLHPLPLGKEKDGHVFSGLQDAETRLRHRHLDLITSKEGRAKLLNRARVISAVRAYFDSQDYLEVETPILQQEAGGASARPFITHINEYDAEVKLRISLELYLKRIICGDVPKVYEVGRVFRNEGVSYKHNPEFTLLEFYEAYANLEDMMVHVENCFKFVAEKVFGTTKVDVPHQDGYVTLDFGQSWARIDMLDEIAKHTGVLREQLLDLETAVEALGPQRRLNAVTGKQVVPSDERNLGGLLEKLLEVYVEPTLIHPTFVVGYPLETSPLAKKDPNDARFTRRFEGYVLGNEVCNSFSEINDPIDQRERFEFQVSEKEAGDDEAHPMDEEFLYALECGMPPTGGCGIGMDRMAMLLTGAQTIREALMFPYMRPAKHEEHTEEE
jgi:lysyl-tRNA synthetase, class II